MDGSLDKKGKARYLPSFGLVAGAAGLGGRLKNEATLVPLPLGTTAEAAVVVVVFLLLLDEGLLEEAPKEEEEEEEEA